MVSEDSAIGLALNEDGDIFFANGQLQTVQGANFTAQNIDERIATRYGELPLENSEGLNRYALIHTSSLDAVASVFKNLILGTHTINSIKSFDIQKDKKNRKINMNYEVDTIFGKNITSDYQL